MIKVGIERLDEHLHLFKNQRVGLITNPTGVDRNFKSTIDLLMEKVNVTALFSPEHGIRGNLQAGVENIKLTAVRAHPSLVKTHDFTQCNSPTITSLISRRDR